MTNWSEIKKGERIFFDNKEGVLLSDTKYISSLSSGLYYADVQWSHGIMDKSFCVSYLGCCTLKEHNEWLEKKHESLEVCTNRGDHWVLFGEDIVDYKSGNLVVSYGMSFKDKRSNYYDSSD
jgi:hypothetical protein